PPPFATFSPARLGTREPKTRTRPGCRAVFNLSGTHQREVRAMARKRPKPEAEPRELTIEESEAALRAWVEASRKRPEIIRSRHETIAKAVLRDFGPPDDLGPHLLTDLPPERARDYW